AGSSPLRLVARFAIPRRSVRGAALPVAVLPAEAAISGDDILTAAFEIAVVAPFDRAAIADARYRAPRTIICLRLAGAEQGNCSECEREQNGWLHGVLRFNRQPRIV